MLNKMGASTEPCERLWLVNVQRRSQLQSYDFEEIQLSIPVQSVKTLKKVRYCGSTGKETMLVGLEDIIVYTKLS